MVRALVGIGAAVVVSGCGVAMDQGEYWKARGTYVTTSSLHDCYLEQVD